MVVLVIDQYDWFSNFPLSGCRFQPGTFMSAGPFAVPSVIVAMLVWLIAYREIVEHHSSRSTIWQRRVLLWATVLGAAPLFLLLTLANFDRMSFRAAMGDIVVIGLGPMLASFVGAYVFVRAAERRLGQRVAYAE